VGQERRLLLGQLKRIHRPDGNQTADVITAITTTPVIQQQIASLADGGTYTFYIWARVPSGTRKISLAIVDNAYAAYLAGPTQVTPTTAWQRFKITGTLAAGQTGLWIVVRQYAPNGDDWTTGDIHLWGACLQHGNDPQKAYARTWALQTPLVKAGLAAGPTVIATPDSTASPLKTTAPAPTSPTAPCSSSPRAANSSSPAAPALATALPNSRPPATRPVGLACSR